MRDLQNEVKELRILVTTLMEEKSTKVREIRTSPAQKFLKGKRSELVSTTNEYAGIYTCIIMLRFGSSISIYSKEILCVISFLLTFATHSSLGSDVFVLCHTFQPGSWRVRTLPHIPVWFVTCWVPLPNIPAWLVT